MKAPIQTMGHVVLNYPSKAVMFDMIQIMQQAGVNYLEIQIPFSEPIADGPLLAAANHHSLKQGTRVAEAFDVMHECTQRFSAVQFLFMSYLNPIFVRGYDAFARDARNAGAVGLIVPDLPLEMAGELDRACDAHGVGHVRVVPPNVTDARLPALIASSSCMTYVAARAGVTGARTRLTQDTRVLLERVRSAHPLVPIAVGFGIATAEDIDFLRGSADIAVIGSASYHVYHAEGLRGVERLWKALVC